ncbi:MAG: UDP-N-acetylmuramoyl-tripeptide--D-alanyl-D-alanine ligase [Clostridia bacterium]|nr:UDP-N-acetylmuramoyl-tripeptide--D-alanyl-D-alanine ligase [Clostridia bacterium]
MMLLIAVGAALGMVIAARSIVHFFQLESYQFPGYYRTLKRNLLRALLPGVILSLVLLGLYFALSAWREQWFFGLAWLLVPGIAGWGIRTAMMDRKAKKPLAFTPRVKRLYFVSLLVYVLGLLGLLSLMKESTAALIVISLMPLFLPVWVALAGLLAWPVEKLISELYFHDAQRILKKHPDLIKIGITGSYGKTSVKYILGTMLAEKYQTLITPASFNTPMGVTKVIRTKLMPAHQVFVAEMGARHVGDIKELCRLVHPTLGVITSVGPQHLDTFKTVERIKNTKYELISALPRTGVSFFPDDGAICRELYDKTKKEKHIVSLNKTDDADVWAENVTVSERGSSFMLCTPSGSIQCETKLLGEHNIQNILLAASVCLKLGLTLRQLRNGIGRIQPVEHRLQLLPNPGGMTIIDDAFNSNPRGAEAALKVLAQFPARRIIITPGMVELGAEEADFNRSFGEKMAASVDVAILVGANHTAPIVEGLKAAGFDESNIHVVRSLNDASALLRQIGHKGDTVLFENDLPDHYQE